MPLEIAITHAHPDHDGMTGAFLDKETTIWMPKGEDLEAPRKQHNIDPAVYTTFDHQTKSFDLGGGRVLKPLLVRGHSDGLRHMEVVNSQSGRKVALLTYGIGAVEIPIQEAYAAAGLKMPE